MSQTHETLKKRAGRFKGLAAKFDTAGKKDDARHYRKLMKRMQRRARLVAPPKKAEGEAKPAEAAKS